jgi:hypothetical protein
MPDTKRPSAARVAALVIWVAREHGDEVVHGESEVLIDN